MKEELEQAALRAVLFADLEQYGRLVAADELATLKFVGRCFDLFRSHCQAYGAEFIKTTGDGVLILFDSASRAVEYAMTIQERIAVMAEERTGIGRFRIGLHVGDVHRRGGDAFGHSVNLAARVQAQAQPGGVCVTREVYWAARDAARYEYRFGGRLPLKNMPEPVALYHVISREAAGEVDSGQRFHISVIDGLSLESEDGEPVALRSRKAQALVGYLALSSGFQEAQDRICALIWPDRKLAEARRAFKKLLENLDASVARASTKALVRRGNVIRINSPQVDIIQIHTRLAEGKIDDLLLHRSDWTDQILFGLDEVSGLFSAWLSVTRHNWRDRIIEALEATLERFKMTEPALRSAAAALLILEPSHEPAARCLIRHYAAVRSPAAAMQVYQSLSSTLQRRFRMAPSAETVALVERLSEAVASGDTDPAPRRRAARMPRIAVGTFLGQSTSVDHAVSGFKSSLIANLSKFREWAVIELQGTAKSEGIDYVLSGRFADAEKDMELFVTLSDPSTGKIIWSDAFVLSTGNWVAVQKRVVGNIASTLEIYLSHDRLGRALQSPHHDLGAYDAWLRGENLLNRWTRRAEDEAEVLFERAIQEEPNFAPAYASLASVYNTRRFIRPGIIRDGTMEERALTLARRAVDLDPLDARNHLVVAWSTATLSRFEQAELHYELAAELNPNSPKTLVSAALGLAFMGRRALANTLLAHALALTSILLDYQWSHIATIRYLSGDFEGAVEAASRSQDVIVDTPGWKAAALRRLGRKDETRAALSQLHSAVAAIWEGPNPVSCDDVLEWFLSAFPIRRDDDQSDLAELRSGK